MFPPQQYFSQSSTTPPGTHVPPVTYQPLFANNTQVDSGLSLIDNLIKNLTNTLALLTQSYKTYLPQTNNQLRTSSISRNQAQIQDGMVVIYRMSRSAEQGHVTNARGSRLQLVIGLGMTKSGQARQLSVITAHSPTAQPCDANLSSADPIYDEAGPSYDSDILSEVHDHDNYQDVVCEHHEVYKMHDDVQPNCIVDLDAEYTGDGNMIPYDQYVKHNTEPVVQNNVSTIPNDAYMMIINEMHEQTTQCVYVKAQNKVVDASLTAKLVTYKEQVELYKKQAKFELTERE
ncbi:hypothetical protein Tco_0540364 [Tanacetum coccineum]